MKPFVKKIKVKEACRRGKPVVEMSPEPEAGGKDKING